MRMRGLRRRPTTESWPASRSEEHTSELQSRPHLVCRLLLEQKQARFTSTLWSVAAQVIQSVLRRSLITWVFRQPRQRSFTDWFFFNDTATTEIYTLSLHDALPI